MDLFSLVKIFREFMSIRNKLKRRSFWIWSMLFVRGIRFNTSLFDLCVLYLMLRISVYKNYFLMKSAKVFYIKS